ncbi:unnamed protein product, partial [Ranitomeya imitator]
APPLTLSRFALGRVESPDLKMPDVCVALFLMLASAPLLLATSGAEPSERNPFEYDYKSLQIAGLIMAGVLCAMGIIILISGKCRCKFNQKEQMRRSQDPQLITPDKPGLGTGGTFQRLSRPWKANSSSISLPLPDDAPNSGDSQDGVQSAH